ncbi:hydroxyacylglutathione hydrolase [Microbacterium marinum]|uniref:Hydroxyacylglutathione hydrolase n=1 Tax=Microbacterium marinum TaxID=421115 RepID=A0A7W7BNJ0_9MICO|nr:MBL fold metallo-hydrolase [Microbacterium marinum]MBB4665924.1 hydroxyacylglutathione hydrolase [Microbacterium marinum]
MLLERLYDDDLAHASYVIGCQRTGEAIVVDPRRDVQVYLDLAARNGMTMTAVTETHIHADYLSGTRELAARTGATVYVSGEGGPDWQYGSGFQDATRMMHGHRIAIGNITVEAVHTPGHTPEHLSFLITDGAASSEPGYLLTGDFVFVGDVGRPDLLDEAAGGVDTRFYGARDLFASLRDRLLTLPDYVQVLPAHGSGSACGKALGAVPSSTVGYERRFAWWAPYLDAGDEQGFIDTLLKDQPDAHAYFARMKRQNRVGPALRGQVSSLTEYSASELRADFEGDRVIVVDTRHHSLVHEGTVPGALNVPGVTKAASYGAWVYDPETETRPLVLLIDSANAAAQFRDHLLRVGIDRVDGFITTLDGLPTVQPKTIAPTDLDQVDAALLLDVRNRTEYTAGHIPGAKQLSGGRVLWHADELPAGKILAYCQSGVRNSVVASALRRAGHDVIELEGSYSAWVAATAPQPTAA